MRAAMTDINFFRDVVVVIVW